MLKKIENFTMSTSYLILASAAAIVVWAFDWGHIGIPVILVLMFLQFVLFKDAMASVPLLFSALFMFSKVMDDFNGIPLYLYLTPVAILLGMIVHMIRFKTPFWKGKMTWGILIMFLAMILSSFNAEEVTINYLFYALIGLLYAFIYLFYRNSLDKDHVEYLMKTMMLMGIVVAAEVLIWFLRVDDVLYAIEHKTIKLGWGISNYIATYLIMFIPATIYYSKKLKIGFPFILLAIFQVAMLLLTASRGGILAFAVIALPLLIFLIFSKNWIQSFVSLLAAVVGIFVIGWINWDWFVALYQRFQTVMLDDSGRWEIYREALDVFLDHPLFGGGLFARIDGNNVYHMYHNTFLHTLATLGILGFLGLLWQLWVQFSVLFRQKTAAMVILIISLAGAHLHGMLDNIYYMPQFMVLMLILVSVVEKSNLLQEPILAQLH